ncbi:hypothetical protein NXC24_PB00436 (plasmid) [Rhizobium sp. NXC24]|nr:hypothetical protein NXC24_PB00436 [Rhizobium sp. NXC24]
MDHIGSSHSKGQPSDGLLKGSGSMFERTAITNAPDTQYFSVFPPKLKSAARRWTQIIMTLVSGPSTYKRKRGADPAGFWWQGACRFGENQAFAGRRREVP